MSLYARSDLMSVSIPTSSGGCGETHIRPVTRGVAAKVWKLDCTKGCEAYLRGDGKRKIIKNIPGDKEQGIPGRMEHVADSHPEWSTTPEGIPPTPDEQHVNRVRTERGAMQLQQLQALAALEGAGLKIPAEAMWLLEQNFDKRVIRGRLICPEGHENAGGSKFCSECAKPMSSAAARAEIGTAEDGGEEQGEADEAPLDIWKLDFKSLQKMCKEHALSAKGTADILRKRLQDAGVS